MRVVGLAATCRWTILTTMVGVSVCLPGTQTLSDDVVFELGFHNPLDKTELSWMAQPGATSYQLLRSTANEFSADCVVFETVDLDR